MNFYRVLRDNKEIGPYSLDEIRKIGLRSSDLVWIDGQSAAWRFPDEVPGLLNLIETPNPKAEDGDQNSNALSTKPKKRYRLTADHRMVEITDEEAASSDIPRISEQPPAPKIEIRQPNLNERLSEKKDDIVPFEDLPFSKKKPADDNSFPLEPELSSTNKIFETEEFKDSPFSKNEDAELPSTLPLEPELDPSQKKPSTTEFVDMENEEEMKNGKPSNSGAFVLVGLLFLVAIVFFGYQWYKDQQAPSIPGAQSDSLSQNNDSTVVDGPNGFASSKSIAMNDDTLGQQQRLADRRVSDSLKKLEIAKAKLAAREKAKVDSLQNAMAAQNIDNTQDNIEPQPPKPKPVKDSAKDTKVNKIRTTEEIAKYVRVGVVQPKSQNNGVAGVKLVVHNINNRNLAKVHINVMYYDNSGNIIQKADIIAPNISVGNSVTVPVADNNSAAYVSYKVTGLLGDHVNLQAGK
ncbi:MAG: hypothetical protein DI598_02755 [Pseudopedobacter saltans]|uniref:GYF domain-containing protein n=1 Tax=Pseudopedobacter saltans TaxID=151895 RepID=A0A2W5H867_9SPHI|nr:MAG: hypothetical protein DI598_02755 [Pseudopedobacter saltans]